jgi:fumarylacetoacetase
MARPIDETHNAGIKSWVDSANSPESDFPIQNLPFGVFRRKHHPDERPRIGVAIGEFVLDLTACARAGMFDTAISKACEEPVLNALMALGPSCSAALRHELHHFLRAGAAGASRGRELVSPHLLPFTGVELLLPANVGDYTDFYTSLHHAMNVGGIFRPANPLLPNYKYVPIAYHGRTSTLVASGTPVLRPQGQVLRNASGAPVFEPTRRLDFELEVGFLIGAGNSLGQPIPVSESEQHVFGVCLLNDWSARDIQAWEYQPLGPFLAKNFATTLSPWVVTLDALAPFRAAATPRSASDPAPLSYLASSRGPEQGAFDLTLEVWISSRHMRERGLDPVRICKVNSRDLYWTTAQMVAHHTSNGCNLRTGDLLASGTISGNSKESRGCLLEITQNGKEPVCLPTGEVRAFLEDEDEVIFRGYCSRQGFRRIGFGECLGVVKEGVRSDEFHPVARLC